MTIKKLYKKLLKAYSPGNPVGNIPKKITLPIALMLLLLASSCEKDPMIRFGFDAQFTKDSHGLVIMDVDKNAETITLEGDIKAEEGEVQVELINPEGTKVFSANIIAPDKVAISEAYMAQTGYWKLKYESMEGAGSINLHLIDGNK